MRDMRDVAASVLIFLVGVVLATNYRDAAARLARTSTWYARSLTTRSRDTDPRLVFTTRLTRIVGGLFALAGLAMSGAAIVTLLSKAES